MIDYCIREAEISDIEAIVRLENQYGDEVYSSNLIESTFDYDYYHTYVILVDNKVIGYISATIILDECNLLKIIIDKEYRKNGFGRELLGFLVDRCKSLSVNRIFLEVRKDNDVAKMFYENFGFRKESERPGYYDGVDAEIFWYYIND